MKINEESAAGSFLEFAHKERMPVIPLLGETGHYAGTKFILRVMRLTVLILMVFMLHLSAATRAQITLKQRNGNLEKALEAIALQSGFDFVYSNSDFYGLKPVTVDLKDATVEAALKACFTGQPLAYVIKDRSVMVRRADLSSIVRSAAVAALIDIKGKVVDSLGNGISGATVMVKGGKKGTTTLGNGDFTLKGVDDASETMLLVSSLGFETREIKMSSGFNYIDLKQSTSRLDEVQIQAYTKTSKRLSTANINGIGAKELEQTPVLNPMLALQGIVPGIIIEQNNGYANNLLKIQIQGTSSINSGVQPLFIVDGAPYQSFPGFTINQSTTGSISGNTGISPLSYLNPNDIESIEVLKDAAATSIYGSRAANGAVIITTKRGKAGDVRIQANIEQGISKAPHLDLLNTEQYLTMRKEGYTNDKLPIPNSSLPRNLINSSNYDLTVWNQGRYTDWQKVLIGNTGKYTQAKLSISGGTGNTTFLLSGNYNRQTNVTLDRNANTTSAIHLNIGNTGANGRLKTEATISYSQNNNRMPDLDLTKTALTLPPNAPALRNPDGSINWVQITPLAAGGDSVATWRNPLADLENKLKLVNRNLVGSINLSYQILPELQFKTGLNYNYLHSDEKLLVPSTSYSPADFQYYSQINYIGYSTFNNLNNFNLQIEPQINFRKNVGPGTLEALAGLTIWKQSGDYQRISVAGFTSDLLLEDLSSASIVDSRASDAFTYKYVAIFGQVNYNIKNKYLFQSAIRRDGSSRFGKENRFHNFGSISAAWVFSEESLIKDHFNVLSFGKLKGSFGTTGNDQIGNYTFQSMYYPNIRANGSGYFGLIGFSDDGNVPNPYLQWESTRKLNIGLDLGFLKDRILIGANFYRNTSDNQIVSSNFPASSGLIMGNINLPAVIENKGIELSISTVNIQSGVFSWKTFANVSFNRNKLVSFPNLGESFYAEQYVVGKPLAISKLYEFVGISAEGLNQFKKGDGSIASSGLTQADKTKLIDFAPQYYGGFGNTLSFGSLSLDFLFSFTKKNVRNYSGGQRPGFGLVNQPAYVFDNRWTPDNPDATLQRFSATYPSTVRQADGNRTSSDAALTNATYARLKNLTLSWDTPKVWINKANIRGLRFYASGQNLLTISQFKGLDPETGSGVLPPLKTFIIGIQVTL